MEVFSCVNLGLCSSNSFSLLAKRHRQRTDRRTQKGVYGVADSRIASKRKNRNSRHETCRSAFFSLSFSDSNLSKRSVYPVGNIYPRNKFCEWTKLRLVFLFRNLTFVLQWAQYRALQSSNEDSDKDCRRRRFLVKSRNFKRARILSV